MTTSKRDEILNSVNSKFGFVPNLLRSMSESPAALSAYLSALDAVATGELSTREQQAVCIVVSSLNDCSYCLAAHGTIALGQGISSEDVVLLQKGQIGDSSPLRPVVEATRLVMEREGRLNDRDVQFLTQLGVTRPKLFDIVALVGIKTISNYIHHIDKTQIDTQFSACCVGGVGSKSSCGKN